MAGGVLSGARILRLAGVCCFALLAYVLARAPLWSPAMAGASARLDGGEELALLPAAWRCTERPVRCTTEVYGDELAVSMSTLFEQPLTCAATFRAQPVSCTPRLWYAPRLKPFLELGALPGVSFTSALMERPWRALDQGLLGERGPLHVYAGMATALVLALALGALVRRREFGWFVCVGGACATFVALNMAWCWRRPRPA